jgi:hypothetical protein
MSDLSEYTKNADEYLTGDFYFCILFTNLPPLFRNVCIYADWLGGGR